MMKSWSRMQICEALTDELVKDLVGRMQDHVRNLSGSIGYSILVEEGGRMVILVTDWQTRQDCLSYHSSRAYRQLVAETQHMLIGGSVVKLFENRTARHEILT